MRKTAIFAALLLAGSPPAADVRLGAVVEIAAPAPPGSTVPNLAAGHGGRVYLTWIEQQPDSTHALRFATLSGRSWSRPRTIALGPKGGWFVNWADFPSLLPLDEDRLTAHWLARSGPGRYAYDIHVATSADGGNTWTKPRILHRDTSESEHGFVAMFPMRDAVGAVWLDGHKHASAKSEAEGEMTLQFAAITRTGEAIGETQLDARVCDCCQTAAALTSAGPVVIYRDRSANEVRDIAIVRRVGGRWTAPRIVHADNWVIPACPVNGPAVAARGRNVAVAWFTGAHDRPRVYVAFSKDAGETFSRPVHIDDGAPGGRVDVQYIDDGNALVSWLERVGQNAEVRVKIARPNGRTGAAKTIAASSGERASGFPHMVQRGHDVVFAWTQPGRPAQVKTAIMELAR